MNKLDYLFSKMKDQDKLYKTFIYLEGQPQHRIIPLKRNELKSSRTLKKKILNQFNYEQSQGTKIKLFIMQIYPTQPEDLKTPINSERNLQLIINFLISYERDIKIQACIVDNQQLKKKQIISQQALQNGQIHFDQNGSLIQQTDPMGQNIPSNEKYDNSLGNVRCQFCKKNNKDIAYLKRCGGLYGPFGEEKNIYVHLLCALWCHSVYLDKNDNLNNVQQQIKRTQNIKCFCCKQPGAGLVCVGQRLTKNNKYVKCKKTYHFKCAYDRNSNLNWLTFKMFCENCEFQQEIIQQSKETNNRRKAKRKTKNGKSRRLKKNKKAIDLQQNSKQKIKQQNLVKYECQANPEDDSKQIY